MGDCYANKLHFHSKSNDPEGGCKAGNDKQYGCFDHKDMRCLGPFKEVKKSEEVMSDIPTFF